MDTNKRQFMLDAVRLLAITSSGFLLKGCTSSNIKGNLGKLTKDLNFYQKSNPNVNFNQKFTFKSKFSSGNDYPGPAWYLSPNTHIYASTPGQVVNVRTYSGGGTNVKGHQISIYNEPFSIVYEHVDKPAVKFKDIIKRGDLIARGVSDKRNNGVQGLPGYFKIALYNNGNCEDPDTYGENYSYMNYWDEKKDLNKNNKNNKISIQWDILNKISNSYNGVLKNDLVKISKQHISFKEFKKNGKYPFQHRNFNGSFLRYTPIERFKILENIYKQDPLKFTLGETKFQNLKQKFYNYQPIILTLPFKKP
jgi:hypothetical protein